MPSTDLENVEPRSWRADTFTLDIELAKPHKENVFASDYYEILRVGPQADEDTIERVYRTLADRFHPDNPRTGDPETFLRLGEAYRTLSNPAKRAEYNVLRQSTKSLARFGLRGREFFDGVRGAQNRRLAVLCLLYRKRISTHESPGLTILDLERLTGCTREELTSALWYLCEKRWSTIGDFTAYSITADGFDFVESKLEDRMEFRALATLSYYDLPAELEDPAHVEFRFWINDALSLDLDPDRTIEGAASIADYYEILGIGPQADEETIERVYLTLAGRFHPDSPGTADADTFLRITEAYDTLSDQAKREQYDALRERTKDSTRFRLRGREFFDGIRGEQLRRLAVLCLLYRQAATESSGLTTLDLEQLTGCTREELGSALWYLREKKWAKSGEFTEYSITAAGFDVVENKVEDREAARSKAWLNPEDGGKEFVYTQVGTAQPVALLSPISNNIVPENQNSHRIAESEQTENITEEPPENAEETQGSVPNEEATGLAEQVTWFEVDAEPAALSEENVPVALLSPISNTIAPENQNSLGIAESEQADIRAEEPSHENTEAAQGSIPNEEATGLAEQVTWFEVDAEPAALSEQNVPVALLSPISNTIAPENQNSHGIAESEQTENITEEAPENAEETQGPIPIEDAIGLAEQVTWFEVEAEPAALSEQNVPVMPQPLISDIIGPANQSSHWIGESEQTEIITEEPPENAEVTQVPIRIEDAPGLAEQITQFEIESESEEREAAGSWAWLYPEDTYGEFVYPYQASATQPAEQSQPNVPVTPHFPTCDTIAPENRNSQRIAESEQTDVKAEEPSDEQPAIAPGLTQIEDAPGAAQLAAPSQPNSGLIDSTNAIAGQAGGVAIGAVKRVILSMGGKGGVGKTSVMTGLAEWFEENRIPATLLDLDTENKAKGSLTHFFGRAPKINIHTPAGLDAFVDHLDDDAPVILADMGAGAGQITHDWFDKMYPDVTDVGIVFTAIGVVTSDPASVDSVLIWAAALQDRVAYVIVENKLTEHADFAYWRENDEAEEFRRRFQPAIIRLDYRLADLENAVRNYGVTLGRVASRTAPGAELQKASLVMRAQSYRRRMFAEFDKVKDLLLP
jgi:curved DNA-binding protein CbpA